jgi:hypothetical protein
MVRWERPNAKQAPVSGTKQVYVVIRRSLLIQMSFLSEDFREIKIGEGKNYRSNFNKKRKIN